MDEAFVSVVIPLHNSEHWITETIGSVLRQNVGPALVEIIVVDNGSTDRSMEIVRGLLSGTSVRHELVSLEKNHGPSYARNVGWRRSHSEWIQFLDSDDLLAASKTNHQLQVATASHQNVAVVYSEWQQYCFGREWAPSGPVFAPSLDGDVIQELLAPSNFIPTGSQLFRRSWLENIGGFDEKCWMIEDVHLSLRLAMAGGKFIFAPAGQALFYYRRRGTSSLSGGRRLDFLTGCVRNLRLAEEHWVRHKMMNEVRLQFLLDSYELLLHNLAALKTSEFEKLLNHVLSLSPKWLPRNPRMRIASKVLGYRLAECVAVRYRSLTKSGNTGYQPDASYSFL